MDKQVLRRWRNGFGAHVYGQAVVVLIQLVGVPVLLHYWGAQVYGEWLILSAIPTYLSMTDLGFSQSAANDMTQRMARGDVDGALAVFQSLGVMVFTVAVVGLLLALALVMVLPIGQWMHFRRLSPLDVRWVLAFLAAEVLIRLTEGVSHAGFRATGDYALHVGIFYSTLFVQSVCVWTTAALGFGPVVAAGAALLVRVVESPAVAWTLVWRHSELSFGVARARGAHLRMLARPAMANLSMPLAQSFNLQGMVIAIGATIGPIAVVTFSTLRTLTRVALQAVMTVSQAAEPELAAAYGSAQPGLLRELYAHALRAGLWLSGAAAALLLGLGGLVLALWTHGAVTMDAALFRWLLASAVLSALWFSPLTVLKAANLHVRAAVVYVAATASAVAIAAALLQAAGHLAAAGMALVLIDLAMIGYTLPAAARLCAAGVGQTVWTALDPAPLFTLVWSAVREH